MSLHLLVAVTVVVNSDKTAFQCMKASAKLLQALETRDKFSIPAGNAVHPSSMANGGCSRSSCERAKHLHIAHLNNDREHVPWRHLQSDVLSLLVVL